MPDYKSFGGDEQDKKYKEEDIDSKNDKLAGYDKTQYVEAILNTALRDVSEQKAIEAKKTERKQLAQTKDPKKGGITQGD